MSSRFVALILDKNREPVYRYNIKAKYGVPAMAEANYLATEHMIRNFIYEAFVVLVENFDKNPPINRMSFHLRWPSEITK